MELCIAPTRLLLESLFGAVQYHITKSTDSRLDRSGESDYRKGQEPFQDRLLQFGVLGFGLLQDGDVGVGVLPEG